MGARRVHCGDILVGHICARAKGKYAENNAVRHCAGGHMRARFSACKRHNENKFFCILARHRGSDTKRTKQRSELPLDRRICPADAGRRAGNTRVLRLPRLRNRPFDGY